MSMKRSETAVIGMIVLSFIMGIYLYNIVPEEMASHWNARGDVDDYMSKFWGLFLMPIVSAGMFILLKVIPTIDPLKKNVDKFRRYFDHFILLIIGFLFYIHILTLLWNLGIEVNMSYGVIPAVSAIMFYAGVMTEHSKRNWFIGIRTPWTLSSDRVWEKTNKMGGKIFKIFALLMVAGMFFEGYLVFFIMVPIFILLIWIMVYSYTEYQKEKK